MHQLGVIGMPARVNSSAVTAATICSLSTSTPLQSKMSTRTPEPAARRRYVGVALGDELLRKIGIAR